MAEFDDSNAEIVQIYRKSVLPKFLQWAVNIHLIIDREKFALCKPASFEKYLISLVLFGTIGWGVLKTKTPKTPKTP